MYGNMTRVMTTASSNRASPEAISQTITGAASTPTTQVTTRKQNSTVATASTIRRVASSPSPARARASAGTKAWVNAPSPNSRRSRLGMRKATLKASSAAPAPKADAITTSRASPVTREATVNREMVDAARSKFMGPNAILAVFAEIHLAPSCYTRKMATSSKAKKKTVRIASGLKRVARTSSSTPPTRRSLALPTRHQELAEGARFGRQGKPPSCSRSRAVDRLGRRTRPVHKNKAARHKSRLSPR